MTNAAQPATGSVASHGAAAVSTRRRRRNRNTPTVGTRSFVRWYHRLGSGLALVVLVVLIGLLTAASAIILIGLLFVFLGNAIG